MRARFPIAGLALWLCACAQPGMNESGGGGGVSRNPYTGESAAIEAGKGLYRLYGCASCHGKSGAGRMGPALNDDEWTFGGDDETLYKLMRGQIPGQTMPSPWGADLTDDKVWKILAYVRSLRMDGDS